MGSSATEQTFRESAGFFFLAAIGAYCIISLLILLRQLIEPFLWAMFLTVGLLLPTVDIVQGMILRFCCCRRKVAGAANDKSITEDIIELAAGSGEGTHEDETEMGVVRGDQQPPRVASMSPGRSPSFTGRGKTWRSTIARSMAICITMMAMLAGLVMLVFVLAQSVRSVRDNWAIYKKGMENITADVQTFLQVVFRKVPSKMINDVSRDVLKGLQEMAYSFIGDVLKKNLANNFFWYLARCEFWLKLGW